MRERPDTLAGERDARRFPWVGVIAGFLVVASVALLLKALLTPAAAPAQAMSQTPGPAAPITGHYAPDATLLDLSDNKIELSSLRGKVVVLNFWYAACEPCRLEMPALERYYQAHKSEGFVVVGVNIADDSQTTSNFVKAIGISYPVFRDPNQRVAIAYHLDKTPSSYIIDRHGVIRQVVIGPLDTSGLERDVQPLLKA
jgi:cytochrome c biogenesis protein CcmG/thiol:disulfide interchange protein DsbE